MDKPDSSSTARAFKISELAENVRGKSMVEQQQRAPFDTYMTAPPGGDRDSLGRPWPDVQVKPRKPRRRKG